MMTCTLNGGPDMVADGRDLEAGRRMPGRRHVCQTRGTARDMSPCLVSLTVMSLSPCLVSMTVFQRDFIESNIEFYISCAQRV